MFFFIGHTDLLLIIALATLICSIFYFFVLFVYLSNWCLANCVTSLFVTILFLKIFSFSFYFYILLHLLRFFASSFCYMNAVRLLYFLFSIFIVRYLWIFYFYTLRRSFRFIFSDFVSSALSH